MADDEKTRTESDRAAGSTQPLPGPLPGLDAFQQRHPLAAVPLAVYKKFSDDDAGKLAALISYFAFLSVFPLLIVLATVLSRVLANHPDLANEIVTTAAGSFLSIGATGTVEPLDISGLALVVAIVVGLWGGLAVANAMQDAMDTVYEVPRTQRAGFIWRVLRSITLLLIVGVGLPASTVLQGVASSAVSGVIASMLILIVVVCINSVLIAAAFRRATGAKTS
ncbi:MAG: YhjD/YihY/BrkB family envelope integrity protein, partial [bacterium]|nr:YhjD/YihY/BrkB family envelope integrity protein [bacterium]